MKVVYTLEIPGSCSKYIEGKSLKNKVKNPAYYIKSRLHSKLQKKKKKERVPFKNWSFVCI